MSNPRVMLTEVEQRMAIQSGQERRLQSAAQKLKDKDFGLSITGRRWDIDIEGAAAEMAYAKFRDFYWGGHVGSFKGADVGSVAQIRSSIHPDAHLILRDNDNPQHFYILVVGQMPAYEIAGWIPGQLAMSPQYRRDPGPNDGPPCFMVPQKNLRGFRSTPEGGGEQR